MTPVTVNAKILLQEIWQTKLTWDEPLPDTIKDRWTTILVELQELPNLLIPRMYFPYNHPGTHVDNILYLQMPVQKLMELLCTSAVTTVFVLPCQRTV